MGRLFLGLRLPLQLVQVVVQAVEALFPEAAVVLQPLGGVLERARLEPAGAPLGLAPALDQAGALEDLEVLGDAAGMIAPLCGNGMAMAIQSARILTREAMPFIRGEISRDEMESKYREKWNDEFSSRLWRGRQIQKLFGRELTSRIAVSLVMSIPPLARSIIKNTHGRPF